MTKLIDLSHPLEGGQRVFPEDPPISVEIHHTIDSIGYNLTKVSLSSHQGTHLDAPYHFFDNGETVDQIDLHRFYGPATVVDLAPGGALEARTPLTAQSFEPHADLFQPGARILYRTGWDRMFGRPEFFTDSPTLTLGAARWIADRKIGLLGMDTPTPSEDWLECHHILLRSGTEIVIVEGLTRLEQLPESFVFIGFPLNLKGRDGSPIRAVAVVEE